MECTNCHAREKDRGGQWWFLNDYFGIWGRFCPDCFDKVSHDSYRKPKHPAEYQKVLKSHSKEVNHE